MTTLFICHDTGNTNVLLRTANTFLSNSNEPIKFLIVGNAAKKIFDKAENKHHQKNTILLSTWLEKENLDSLDNRSLTQDELSIVTKRLIELQVSKAIIGCPCWETALTPFQIAEKLSKILSPETNFLYNGEFLYDLEHNPFWTKINTPWMSDLTLLVAFPEAQRLSISKNSTAKVSVVGSSALDDMFEAESDPIKKQNIREQLNISTEQHFLFISGSKFIDDDIALLDNLYQSLKEHPEITVQIGLHPGTANISAYVARVLNWLDSHNEVSANVIITPVLEEKIAKSNSTLLTHRCIKLINVTGDQLFTASDSIASPQPTTLATQGIIQNKPTYCLPSYVHLSYAHTFFSTSPDTLHKSASKRKMDKNDIGLPSESAHQLIYRMMKG
jgi:hypothetical protein